MEQVPIDRFEAKKLANELKFKRLSVESMKVGLNDTLRQMEVFHSALKSLEPELKFKTKEEAEPEHWARVRAQHFMDEQNKIKLVGGR